MSDTNNKLLSPVLLQLDEGPKAVMQADPKGSYLHWTDAPSFGIESTKEQPDGRFGVEYLLSLQVGERVVETGHNAYFGAVGTIYESSRGKEAGPCVRWEDGMGTSVTHGTRRISDVLAELEYWKNTTKAKGAANGTMRNFMDKDVATIVQLNAEIKEDKATIARLSAELYEARSKKSE